MARPLALPPGWNSAAGHRHEARRNEVEAHGQSRHGKHLSRVADAACGTLWVVVRVAAHERHHAHAGLEARVSTAGTRATIRPALTGDCRSWRTTWIANLRRWRGSPRIRRGPRPRRPSSTTGRLAPRTPRCR